MPVEKVSPLNDEAREESEATETASDAGKPALSRRVFLRGAGRCDGTPVDGVASGLGFRWPQQSQATSSTPPKRFRGAVHGNGHQSQQLVGKRRRRTDAAEQKSPAA